MQVNKFSSVTNFLGSSKKQEKNNEENEYTQVNSCASKNASRAIRNLAMGLMLLGAAASCTNDKQNRDNCEPLCSAEYHSTKLPIEIEDSIKSQASNIGIPIYGCGDNILSVRTVNRYDNIAYETTTDADEIGDNKFDMITKIIDRNDNSVIGYAGINFEDLKGKGIKVNRFFSKDKENWSDAGYEIRSNGSRGNSKGVNFVEVYDKNGNLIGKYNETKSNRKGQFYSQYYSQQDDEIIEYPFASEINLK